MALAFAAPPHPSRASPAVPPAALRPAAAAPRGPVGGARALGGALLLAAGSLRQRRRRVAAKGIARPAPVGELPGLSRPYDSAIDADEFLGGGGKDVLKFTDVDGDLVRLVRHERDVEVFVNGDLLWRGVPTFHRGGGRLLCGDGHCDVPPGKRDALQIFLSGVGGGQAGAGDSQQPAQGSSSSDEDDEYAWVKGLDKLA